MHTRTTVSSGLIAYTDESGNTGNHLFDLDQPYFWTGTLLSKPDFDRHAKLHVYQWCRSLGEQELHGSQLGLQRIERVARELEALIVIHDARFVFTRLEKQHLAATKFVDTFFDSGINRAVSAVHYSSPLLRSHITLVFAELMSLEDRIEFWQAYRDGGGQKFYNVLERVGQSARTHVSNLRTRQVLTETIGWAQQHPENFLQEFNSDLDSPNAVSLSLLIQCLHDDLGNTGQKLTRLIHDETSQFGLALKATFSALRGFESYWRDSTDLIPEITETNTLDCPIEMVSSTITPSLQVVDVVLWLVRRSVDRGLRRFSNCKRLVGQILRRSLLARFTRQALQEEVDRVYFEVMNVQVSDSEMKRGSKIVESLERERKKRMSESIAITGTSISSNPRKHEREFKNILRDLALRAEKVPDR